MTFQSGALPDTRTDLEKQKDYQFAEIVASAAPVQWFEKLPSSWRKFPIFNQDSSGSCVAQTQAKELGIMRWLKDGNYVHFSATDIYSRRVNKPSAGMIGNDARLIASQGVTLEALTPSQNMTDSQMDGTSIEPYKREVGKIFSVPNYITVPVKDIETIASIIQQTGKGVMVWFYFKLDEWTEDPIIRYPSLTLQEGLHHSVCAVDFTLVNGERCLIIEDSWGSIFGLAGQRVIDQTFFEARNYYASYLVNFKFDEQTIPKPYHFFPSQMKFGDTNTHVSALQSILRYEGFFPSNVTVTGYYGSITAKGVLAWQKLHKVAPDSELNPLQGKLCGAKTIAMLNQLYSV